MEIQNSNIEVVGQVDYEPVLKCKSKKNQYDKNIFGNITKVVMKKVLCKKY